MIGWQALPRMRALVTALTGEEEIVPPGLILEIDRPEYSFLKRERLWAVKITLAALAANINSFSVLPNSKTVLAVVTHLFTDQDSEVGLVKSTSGYSGTVGATSRDGRGVAPTTIAQSKQVALASATLPPAGRWILKANLYQQLPAHVELAFPSLFAIVIESIAVNVAQNLWAAGYERASRAEEQADV